MQITEITANKVFTEGKLKALFSVVLNNEIVIHNIKVIEGNKGLFVSMPGRKLSNGDYVDVVHPIKKDVRELLDKSILNKYEELSNPL